MYRAVDGLARVFALLGGAVLTGLILLTCVSIAGRLINAILYSDLIQNAAPDIAAALLASGVGSISGAFEVVEAGMAFVIFAFLPICQLHGAHASVDIFTSRLPERGRDVLRAVTEGVFALVIVVIAWQLFQGLLSKRATGQTSFILQFPVWWPYALSLIGAVASACVAVFVAGARVAELVTGRLILPIEAEAEP